MASPGKSALADSTGRGGGLALGAWLGLFLGGLCFSTAFSQVNGGRAVCQPEQGQVLQGCSSQGRELGLSSPVTTANPLLLPLSAAWPRETGSACDVRAGVTL